MIMDDVAINIETERLLLRNLKPEDVSIDYVNWLNDPEVNRYLSCAGKQQTLETCRDYVRSYPGVLIGIFLKDDNRHIGNLTLSTVDWQKKEAALGISIGRKECMGKGLGKEALKAIVEDCFRHLGLDRVYAGVHVANTASRNLFTACGFAIDKSLTPDSYIVSITNKEFGK